MALTFEDYLPVIIAALFSFIASIVVLLVGRHLNVFDKSKQQGTDSVQSDLLELKQMHKDLLGTLEDRLESVSKDHKEEFRRIFDKVDKINTEVYNLGWRVRELESHLKRSGSVGGSLM